MIAYVEYSTAADPTVTNDGNIIDNILDPEPLMAADPDPLYPNIPIPSESLDTVPAERKKRHPIVVAPSTRVLRSTSTGGAHTIFNHKDHSVIQLKPSAGKHEYGLHISVKKALSKLGIIALEAMFIETYQMIDKKVWFVLDPSQLTPDEILSLIN
jgi:hypothetical protein